MIGVVPVLGCILLFQHLRRDRAVVVVLVRIEPVMEIEKGGTRRKVVAGGMLKISFSITGSGSVRNHEVNLSCSSFRVFVKTKNKYNNNITEKRKGRTCDEILHKNSHKPYNERSQYIILQYV